MKFKRNIAIAVLGIIGLAAGVGAATSLQKAVPTVGPIRWIRVSDALLSGKGLTEAFDMAQMGQFTDYVEDQKAIATHKAPYLGQLRVNVIETTGNSVHLPNFPNDEFVDIIAGGLTLTADDTKVEQTFYAGDRVMIPKGWSGTWRVHAGVFREIAITPSNYFDGSGQSQPAPKGVAAFLIDPPKTAGIYVVHDGTYTLEAENVSSARTLALVQGTDEAIHILHGNLSLKTGDESEIFKPGDIVVIPKGFRGESYVTAGYRAITARAK
jgi:uncharacterized cupin superfamily protein